MPKFTGQNKKRIDPRYFLDETTNRDETNQLPLIDAETMSFDDNLAAIKRRDAAPLPQEFEDNIQAILASGEEKEHNRNLSYVPYSDEELKLTWKQAERYPQDRRDVEMEIVRRIRKESEKGWTDSQLQAKDAREQRITARALARDN